jgi:hypothetical protein
MSPSSPPHRNRLRQLAERVRRVLGRAAHHREPFPGSAEYWNERYARGGDSGAGSYGKFAAFKSRTLNALFAEHGIHSVVEFGCGDGNQLASLQVDDYLGVDVSPQAIARCRDRFAGQPGRQFLLAGDYRDDDTGRRRFDAALSLDVIYHLIEDPVYEAYMRRLFDAAERLVIVYASNHEDPLRREAVHVRHREFTRWVAANTPQWQRVKHIPNEFPFRGDHREGSFADFHVFAHAG